MAWFERKSSAIKSEFKEILKNIFVFLRKICLLVVLRLPVPPALRPRPPLLSLKRAGTTFAALSRASKVITQDATTMKPLKEIKIEKKL
jgi:hypothetical protein